MQQYKLLIASYSNREEGDRFPNMNYAQNKGFLSKELAVLATKILAELGFGFFFYRMQALKLLMLGVSHSLRLWHFSLHKLDFQWAGKCSHIGSA